MTEEKRETGKSPGLTRREFLKTVAVAPAAFFVDPDAIERLTSPETDPLTEKPLVNTDIISPQFESQTNLGYKTSLIPKKEQSNSGESGVTLNNLLDPDIFKALEPKFKEKGIDAASVVWGKDFATPTWQVFCDEPENNYKVQEAISKSDGEILIPEILAKLKDRKVKGKQMLVIPPEGRQGSYGVVVWTGDNGLNVEKIEAPTTPEMWSSNSISYGPMDVVGEGVVRVITTDWNTGDESRKLVSFGTNMIEIPGSATKRIHRTPAENHQASLKSTDNSTIVTEAYGGGVVKYSRDSKGSHISVWDVKNGDFGKPVTIEENFIFKGGKAPVFLFRDSICLIGLKKIDRHLVSTKPKREVVLSAYAPDMGKKIGSLPLESHAAYELALIGSFTPDLERNSRRIANLAQTLGSKTVNSLDTTPSVAIKCPGPLSNNSQESALAIIQDVGWGVFTMKENPTLVKETDIPPAPEVPVPDMQTVTA